METGVEGVEEETMGADPADIMLQECRGECWLMGEEGILLVVEREGIISSVLALLLLTPFFFGSVCPCFFLLYSVISLSA